MCDMGLMDYDKNLKALVEVKGDLEQAFDKVLGQM
jgi:hypothetical protein